WEKLEGTEDAVKLRKTHALHFLAFVERMAQHGREPVWRNHLEQELGNVRAALDWAAKTDMDLAFGGASQLRYFWEDSGRVTEGKEQLIKYLSNSDVSVLSANKVAALDAAADLAQIEGDYLLAETVAQQGLK